jgi:cytochrome c553
MFYLAVVASMALAGAAQAQGDASAGQEKAGTCAGCHGPDGNSPSDMFPKIAGQHAGYIAKQLADYKSGDRKDATMAPMAANLEEQDMQDLAAHYAAQEARVGEAQPDYVELGAKLYRGGDSKRGIPACMGCHDPSGSGNAAARFPALAGQHAAYTIKTLQAFRAGERANDSSAMMRTIAMRMNDDEMKAVAEYIAGLY